MGEGEGVGGVGLAGRCHGERGREAGRGLIKNILLIFLFLISIMGLIKSRERVWGRGVR